MMKNEKWKTENKSALGRTVSDFRSSFTVLKNCPACGAEVPREMARYCSVCGKLLLEEYQPLDNLRSSYGLQGKSFDLEKRKAEPEIYLFEQNKNGAADAAWACFVYSMVPYLGILFIPLTFSISIFGYFTALRHPELGGGKLALASFYLSFLILAIQLFLWWLLYFVPKIPPL